MRCKEGGQRKRKKNETLLKAVNIYFYAIMTDTR